MDLLLGGRRQPPSDGHELGRATTHTHTFHQSWLGDFFTCPERARSQLAGDYPPDDTDASAKGTAMHAGIEALLRGSDWYSAQQRALDTFVKLSSAPHFRWVKVKTLDTALKHVCDGLAKWVQHVLPQLGTPLLVERKFKFLIHRDDEREIRLAGQIDYADDTGVYDWKLTGNLDKYDGQYGGDGWMLKRWSLQATAYSWAMYRLYDWLPVDFTFVAIDPHATWPVWLPMQRNAQHFSWFERQLVSVAKQVESGMDSWPLNDQHALCSPDWCLLWSQCKGAHMDEPTLKQKQKQKQKQLETV